MSSKAEEVPPSAPIVEFPTYVREMGPKEESWPTDPKSYVLGERLTHKPNVAGKNLANFISVAYCKTVKQACAIKVRSLESATPTKMDLPQQMRLEAEALTTLTHDNILPGYAVFQVENSVWYVTKLCTNTSLDYFLRKKAQNDPNSYYGIMALENVAYITKQVLKGLNYMHSKGWVHCDISAKSIFLDANGFVYIGDLDRCAKLDPENPSDDIRSLGISVLEIANGPIALWGLKNQEKVMQAIVDLEPPTSLLEMVKDQLMFRKVVAKCLQEDSTSRPTASDLLKYEFMNKSKGREFFVTFLESYSEELNLQPLYDKVRELEEEEERMKEAAASAAEEPVTPAAMQ